MKQTLITFLSWFLISGSVFSQITISSARQQSIGAQVTVNGVVTNGNELGTIRYLQDPTGGIAVYSSSMSSVQRGDSISVTGTLSDYNNLLEISPVSNFTVISSGNTLPDPVILTPDQLSDTYEAQLVRIENAVFDLAGSTFQGKTNYNFTANGQTGEIRISDNASPLAGTVIPSGEVTIIGPLGQYQSAYQVLPRDENDLIPANSINLTSPVTVSNITTTGFSLTWGTDNPGTSELKFGNTPELELGFLPSSGTGTSHTYSITGRSPSEILYIMAFSVNGSDTAKSNTGTYITASNSTGDIKVYFNRSVDHSVSTGTDAIQLDHAIDDTLIKYIERAQESIDVTIYNFDNSGISNISTALNAAYDRGIKVRVIYDSDAGNAGINDLDPGIGTLADPVQGYPDYGIMHNKFVIFDAYVSDPDVPIVWTGSTNFTDGQINTDANNVIILQDQSLAKAYTLEFNEMFGSTGLQPDPGKSRFGPDKTDNTPHEFVIGGRRVECYFSPSDGTTSKILGAINSADADLSVAAMIITRNELGYAIRDRANAGVTAKVLVNSDTDPSMATVKTTLESALGTNFRKTGESGIMHHKYLIVDNSNPTSDPLVLTGSHNWSSSAEYRNDENTLIVHDATIANIYYQEFTQRFANGNIIVEVPECKNDYVTLDKNQDTTVNVTANDQIPGSFTLTLLNNPPHGTALNNGDGTITYTPEQDFLGLDTVSYKVCLVSSPDYCSSADMVVLVQSPAAVNTLAEISVTIYPNPGEGQFTVSAGIPISNIRVLSLAGKVLMQQPHETGLTTTDLTLDKMKGIFILEISTEKGVVRKKIIVR
ncbi:MAG: T9SS type A sorting domain-containing protein [Chlorobi bacterium]|nr:T9SS type A sorting domain-containing protein [Chlorobiota bacterium]